MHMHTPLHKLCVPLLILLLVLVNVQCGENSTTNPGNGATVPDLPPQSSFVIDFTTFPLVAGVPGKATTDAGTEAYGNWQWAATNVFVWNTLLTVSLSIPVISYVESFKHEPVQQDDGSWVWSYSFTTAGAQHTAELHAALNNEGIRWDMYISKEGAYSQFHWYTGESNLFTTDGYWIVNMNPEEPHEALRIDWDRDADTTIANTKYTNIIPGNSDNGSYIDFGITNDTPFDAFYEIYSSSKENLTTIEWSRATKEGRVRDTLHFGDGEFQAFADSHWRYVENADSPVDADDYTEPTYWEWLKYHFQEVNLPRFGSVDDLDPYDHEQINELLEETVTRTGSSIHGYSVHHLPNGKTQQYYEMIGKYPQFVFGWEDVDDVDADGNPINPTVRQGDSINYGESVRNINSPMREEYEDMRENASGYWHCWDTSLQDIECP